MSSTSRATLQRRLILQYRELYARNTATPFTCTTIPQATFHTRAAGRSKIYNKTRSRYQSIFAGQQRQPNDLLLPSRRSQILRITWSFVKWGTVLTAAFALGMASGLSESAKEKLKTLASPSLTDEETLLPAAYTPPDDDSAAINTRILTHPIAASLRANPSFTESRPHLKIPEAVRRLNLTGGVLAGPGRIVVPPLQFVEEQGKAYVAIFYLGPELCGHPGVIHGGLLATLLDEGLARCCFQALPNGVGVTANLKIDYRRPVLAEGYYVLRARTEKVDGRKAWVKGWIERLRDGGEEISMSTGVRRNEEGDSNEQVDVREKLVEAEALFVEPKNAKFLASIYRSRAKA